jgi:ABC-type phosphate transport system substrate-binding protein
MARRPLGLLLFLTCASGVWGQRKSEVIHVDGDHSMMPLAQRLTEWYHQNERSTWFEIAGGGPSRAIESLVDGKVDVVQSARQVLGGEVMALRKRRSQKFLQIPVATEVAGVLVHRCSIHAQIRHG